MTDTIFFEIDFLHLGIEKGDGDDEEKADKPGSFLVMKNVEFGEMVEEVMTGNV